MWKWVIGKFVPGEAVPIGVRKNDGTLDFLRLNAAGALPVAVTGAGSGGTSSTDGDAFTAGVSAGTPGMGVFESAPSTVADGKIGLVGITNDRRLKVSSSPPTSTTSALTNVPENLASVTLLASNTARVAVEIYNDSDGVLLVKPGIGASATSFSWRVMPRSSLTTEQIGANYTGRLDGIWELTPGTVGHAAARVTELT